MREDGRVSDEQRVLVAVFATPVASYLLRYGKDLGYTTVLFEPDGARATDVANGFEAVSTVPGLGAGTDVVVTDHNRPELGEVLKAVLDHPARWVGVLGNPRRVGPHVAALKALDVPENQIARVQRPVGLNIGSRTPPEIAVATLAGLLADRNGRPGGFEFPPPGD
ncbi:xanthine dehydrogenase [Amycolatopsis regifaucium]|uniref:Xanthine dehydrogenase n=1 Tax=Amycolatopsis regifaucium TaxID=546365 RepID=A0A154MS17_9PSEU|nr:xanthine dehydrogenase [Amycolatopsis regifaucium]OKA05152.1 xanthine dehydrogenase [Amycolatopsis regifaucium]SFH83824.1 XdhC Rossmann domain-containing protein [Amycolatopsis regifaucium]